MPVLETLFVAPNLGSELPLRLLHELHVALGVMSALSRQFTPTPADFADGISCTSHLVRPNTGIRLSGDVDLELLATSLSVTSDGLD